MSVYPQSDRTMDVSYVLRRSATPEFFTKLFVHARSMEEEAARPRPAAGAKPRFQPTPTVTIPMPELSKYFRVNVRDVRAYVFPMPAGVSQVCTSHQTCITGTRWMIIVRGLSN